MRLAKRKASYEVKWFIRYGFPYPRFIDEEFNTVREAAEGVDKYGLSHWNVELVTESFGGGGCHRAVWSSSKGKWVNPRTGTAWWGAGDPNNEFEIHD